jgi:hypothetical protein
VPTGITRSEWQHYTVTYTSGGALKTYFDGSLVDTTTMPAETSPKDYGNNPMFFDLFGFSPTNFGHGSYLTGDLGEFRFYDRTLSAAEVQQNYGATRSRWN